MRLCARLVPLLALAVVPLVAPPASAAPVRSGETVCPPDRLPPLPFADVAPDAVLAREIACALGFGVARGVDSTHFAPGAAIARGHVAVLLARAATLAGAHLPPGEESFRDMADAPQEMRDAVTRLADAGVVAGYDDETFRPWLPVTRAQAASFLVRLQRVLGGPLPPPEDCFDDVSGDVHREAIGQVCALGVVQGDATRRYQPRSALSRAHLAAMLVRLLDVDAEAGLVDPLQPVPPYSGQASTIDDEFARTRMPYSHRSGCPIPLEDLRLLTVRHWGFDGATHLGELVVHADAAQAVVDAFRRMYAARVVIERVRLVDEYGGDDDASMAANNTSAYNCRTVAGTSTWSEHAYGRAVDVNPVQNPYVTARQVEPTAGREYLDRSHVRPGMAVSGGALVEAFTASGWGWGGTWSSAKDYQHFSASGR